MSIFSKRYPYEVVCNMNIFTTYDAWIQVPYSSEHRNNLITYGIKVAEDLYESFISRRDSLIEQQDNDASVNDEA